ncbi:small RNA degrading nuclease 1 [Cynara cardunculus var. scolymus]|uniref:small RNA degrading nuclease 1 n=1 Tax=Cynara cardunculus var. scolymus TaxID=59895 RepID=UPI000D6301F2|nr:small RNA degrading nuclease 1 [Cynara cardunculus var. scolymus]
MEKIEKSPKEVLVDIVKLAQKRGMKGSNGGWKDFLSVYDKKVGISLSDPARRTPEALIAFLKTFSNDEDLKFFDKVVEKHDSVEHMEKKTDKMSPEQELVYKTVGHPQYALSYSFPSHEEGWLVTKHRKKNKAMRSNAMVAVDCEMVLCEDGTDALVRVCVVDRDLQVKLDELVKPEKAVADYRSNITGVAAKDLENVTCSLEDVQESMMKLLARGTILVGHSLNNDLQALKVDHSRIIDTSLVFKYWSGSNFRRPSLNDLCKLILGYELRKEGAPHDCVEDARAAMKLVLAKIEGGVDNTLPSNQNDVHETEAMKLLCHRIPINIPGEKLLEVIPGDFTIESKANKKAGGDKYSAFAVFKNKQEADQAFEKLEGDQVKDSSGRPQKLISFKLDSGIAGSIYVRKMVEDSDNVQIPSKKRAAEDDIPTQPKKLKTEPKETIECDHCDGYLKEIETLKKKLGERDQEISTLHKIIVSQARKQTGL